MTIVIFEKRLEKVKFMYRVVAATYGTLCERTFGFETFKWSSDDSRYYSNESDYSLALEIAAKELYATYSDFCK